MTSLIDQNKTSITIGTAVGVVVAVLALYAQLYSLNSNFAINSIKLTSVESAIAEIKVSLKDAIIGQNIQYSNLEKRVRDLEILINK